MSRLKLDDRLRAVEEMLVQGVSPHVAARLVAEKFNVGLRQGQKYVRRVFSQWAELDVEQRTYRKAQVRRMTIALFQRCYETKQLGAAVQALVVLGNLDGLLDGPATGDTRSGFDPKSLSPVERRERIKELISRAISGDPELAETARKVLANLE